MRDDPPIAANEEAIRAWDGPLYDRFVRFREIVTTGLGAHGEAALEHLRDVALANRGGLPQHPALGGVKSEVARGLAAAGDAGIAGEWGQLVRSGVNVEADDEVVASVGEVGEAAIAGEQRRVLWTRAKL